MPYFVVQQKERNFCYIYHLTQRPVLLTWNKGDFFGVQLGQ